MRIGPDLWPEVLAALQGGAPCSDRLAAVLVPAQGSDPELVADRVALVRLAAERRLTVDVFEVPGGFLAAAQMTADAAGGPVETVSGKGFDSAGAVLGCLGEAAELASWLVRAADQQDAEPVASATEPVLGADTLLGFSPAQWRHRGRLNRAWAGFDRIPAPSMTDSPLHWVSVSDFGGRSSARVPAFACLGRFGSTVLNDPTADTDSNGLAVAPSASAARQAALLEVVERDAAGLWWQHGIWRARLPAGAVDSKRMHAALRAHAEDTGRALWFVELSAFSSASVVAAISCDRDGHGVALGFGARFSPVDAAETAFLELIQTETALEAHRIRRDSGRTVDADRLLARWQERVSIHALPFLRGTAPGAVPDAPRAGGIADLADELAAAGHRPWFLDLTRPEIGIAAAKAIVPGLCHYKPRLGVARLYKEPSRRGWATSIRPGRAPPLLV